jgi:hypothetical protein
MLPLGEVHRRNDEPDPSHALRMTMGALRMTMTALSMTVLRMTIEG